MFILEKPYVSDLLKNTLTELKANVLDNETARTAMQDSPLSLVNEQDFINFYKANPDQPVYSNSENAINWIDNNLTSGDLSQKIRLFKDKAAFRDLVKDLYPDFFYKTVPFEELDSINPEDLPIPCVIKPSVGFFSLGVHIVESIQGWHDAVTAIKEEIEHIKTMYPAKVLELDMFIIEQCIEGEEFAVDAYFDKEGKPVILDILGHLFASSDDVSDRVYITSTDIIKKWHDKFEGLLTEIGKRAGLKNFPLHIEIRGYEKGNLGVIEVNPMRFAGWCVTDLAYFAYGINPYKYFMEGLTPDWDEIFAKNKDKVCAMTIGEIDSNVDRSKIKDINYESFNSYFTKPLELRKIDYKEFPVFAFMFAEVKKDNMAELKKILHADLSEYLIFE
ncbi:ATP-grasp domain-containing protein [Maridesulfovibrio ferrireducens]|uniref:ATP-grasp domain-containing protein n=1 Tax=Maridesulfovibrio ferrireducens TaxID=246191 RepID=UPI001A2455F3|nr:ATP-grasp domain-containing protein [Maridesulfovibrio ferrireducens]MBI9112929.1 ATP-grasp domain-containing protein [Maridesulfovibrio ferrireducens]